MKVSTLSLLTLLSVAYGQEERNGENGEEGAVMNKRAWGGSSNNNNNNNWSHNRPGSSNNNNNNNNWSHNRPGNNHNNNNWNNRPNGGGSSWNWGSRKIRNKFYRYGRYWQMSSRPDNYFISRLRYRPSNYYGQYFQYLYTYNSSFRKNWDYSQYFRNQWNSNQNFCYNWIVTINFSM